MLQAFGVRAVLGDRTLSVAEMRSLLAVQNIKRLYAEWQQAPQRLIWEADHPEFAEMLDALQEQDQDVNDANT